MSSSRIFLPFTTGAIPKVPDDVLFIGAHPDQELRVFGNVDCMQTHKPHFDALSAQGFNCIERSEKKYVLTLLNLSRFRMLNRTSFAQAWMATKNEGKILVSGDKTDGVDAFLKEISGICAVDGRLSKAHGKVFWLSKTETAPDEIAKWLRLAAPRKNLDDFYTSPGLFSADGVDPGSVLLSEIFGPKLKGTGADLGAGWGYLSATALASSEKIDRVDLFEANLNALNAAKLNVTDERAIFHWSNVLTLPTKPQYDFVISNPPFHEGRKSEPQIGQNFLQLAARILKAKGTLYIVANRHLPYEATLNACFKRVEKTKETPHYKVFIASGPQSGKP